MSLVRKVNIMSKSKNFQHMEELLKRIEKFDDIKPEETVWSEQRLLQTVRSFVQAENNAY